MNHMATSRKNGFTIVELMLAMAFLTMLLLVIALTTIQISNIYTKGLTLKNVNQAGGAIANELQHGIIGSSPFAIDGSNYKSSDKGGILCTGTYTYIWNTGSAIDSKDAERYIYSSGSSKEIRFIKIYDSGNSYCVEPTKTIDDQSSIKPIEMLDAGQYNLVIHRLRVKSFNSAADDIIHQRLYSIEFFIGTNDQKAINFDTFSCNQEGEDSNPLYCSVSQFNIVARAGGSIQ